MISESLWKNLKRNTLLAFTAPRLDFTVWLFLSEVSNSIEQKLHRILGHTRNGRATRLLSWQEDFKRQWLDSSLSDEHRNVKKELTVLRKKATTWRDKQARAERIEQIREEAERSAGVYKTSVSSWSCSCLSFTLSRFLLCKHLVRATNTELGKPDGKVGLEFFSLLRRRYDAPFYYIQGIHFSGSQLPSEQLPYGEFPSPNQPPTISDCSSLAIGPTPPALTEGSDAEELDCMARESEAGETERAEVVEAARSSSPSIGDDHVDDFEDDEDAMIDGNNRVSDRLSLYYLVVHTRNSRFTLLPAT
jgi:hypothetical protein